MTAAFKWHKLGSDRIEMILFGNIEAWLDRAQTTIVRAGRGGALLESPPSSLPGIDVILCGQPGSGNGSGGTVSG